VLNGANDSQLQSASGTSATFKVGDTLRLTTNSLNNKVIPITPTLSMGSATMANNTRNASTTVARLEALAFHVITYDADGDVDSDDGFGPVYQESFPVGTTEASIFNSTFNIGGFKSPVLDAFNIVPRPIVEVRKNVVPANAPGRFNLKIDSTILAANVGDAGTTGRTVVEPGTRVISETAGTGANLSFFDMSITCVASDGGAVHTQSAGAASMNLVLTGGEDLICTIKNRLPAPSECDTMVFDNVILGTPGGNVADRLNGTNQRDIIIGYGGDDIIDSGAGDDCVSGNAGNDRIELGAGNDVGDGGTGNDQIGAGPGDDILHGGSGNDQLDGGADDDLVYGEDGDDVVAGGDGADVIKGGDGNDTLTGGNGNDNLDGGAGIDVTNGSNGIDICVAESKTNCES
jgi:Ca2+-binding RTX toxin-like protein